MWWALLWHAAHPSPSGPCKIMKALQAACTHAPMPSAVLQRAIQGHEFTLQV